MRGRVLITGGAGFTGSRVAHAVFLFAAAVGVVQGLYDVRLHQGGLAFDALHTRPEGFMKAPITVGP